TDTMTANLHIIDPDGEVTIVLHHPNAPFAAFDKEVGNDNNGDIDSPDGDTSDSRQEHDEVRFQVSAKHMILASPVFKRLLKGPWKEGTELAKQGSVEVVVDSWDSEALLILLNILHCRHRDLPHEMSVEQLAKIAVITDYYDCHASVEIFTDMWVKSFRPASSDTPFNEMIMRLFIAWVFRRREAWDQVHIDVMKWSQRSIHSFGLPFPDRLIGNAPSPRPNPVTYGLNKGREDAMNTIIDSLHGSVTKLITSTNEGENGFDKRCFDCGSSMLGALMKQMHSASLLWPRPMPPFDGLSFDGLVKTLLVFENPK
ncbi:hypothetical protein P170DRAFT_319011, partial [Aspergillus steynii IBT 23096]